MNKANFKAVRFYVTENCNAKCPNCFNAQSRSNDEMDLIKYEQLCKFFNSHNIECLKIMGGEPTLHPSFEDIIKIAQKYFPRISIFSNGLSKKLQNIILREKDGIIYNFRFSDMFTDESFVLEKPGRRCFEIQINPQTDSNKLFDKIISLIGKNDEKFKISLTLDCTKDIFLERKKTLPILQKLETLLLERHIQFSYDHAIPYCYLYNSGIHPGKNFICHFNDALLIDGGFNLRFCNQHSNKITNIFNNEKILPWAIIQNYLYESYYEIQLKALRKICKECVFYNTICNGGCWITSPKITRESILENTDFPKKKKI